MARNVFAAVLTPLEIAQRAPHLSHTATAANTGGRSDVESLDSEAFVSGRARRGYRWLSLPTVMSIAVAIASACGPFRQSADAGQAFITFENESVEQAEVFVVTPGSQAVRLGTVFAGRTETLAVPSSIVSRGGQVNVVARFLARSTTAQSGPIPIRRGERLDVRLPIDMRLLVVLPSRQ